MMLPGTAVRKTITEPELMHQPMLTSGMTVGRFDPMGRVIKDPAIPHPTYAQQNIASYQGRLPALPPFLA